MISYSDAELMQLALHKVGNKQNEEELKLSNATIQVPEEVEQLLLHYFLTPFKSEEYFNLNRGEDGNKNDVYTAVCQIFDDRTTLFEQSKVLAKLLYDQSMHPKIKGGEFYVAYFSECVINGEVTDAVGLFKTETKDTFLKIFPKGQTFTISGESGININKLDKGCLIFNVEREDGFVATVVDNTNKGAEALYWTDDFLHVVHRQDEYHDTQRTMEMCKEFVTRELPHQFEDISRVDQADLLNKSMKFFKEQEKFDVGAYENEVFGQPEVIESFKQYRDNYQQEHGVELADSFDISNSAVRKQQRFLKSIIKLDKNFHIYIHGNRKYILKGFDEESGMHYYQLFFDEEQ